MTAHEIESASASDQEQTISAADHPLFEGTYGFTNHPLRHLLMAATVWRLAADFPSLPLRALEVGSWCGASALTWAHAMARYSVPRGEITCVDPWKPYLDTDENPNRTTLGMQEALRNDEPFQVFRRNIRFVPDGIDVKFVREVSSNTLPKLARENYHLVYIDGDHSYEAVRNDIDNSLPLVMEGGVICGDDLELQADECDTLIVDERPHLDLHYIPDTDKHFHPGVSRAVGECFGRVSAWYGFWAMRRRNGIWEDVSLDGMPFYLPPHLPGDSLVRIKSALFGLGNPSVAKR